MTVMVDGCPCGDLHPMSDATHAEYTAVTAGQPETIRVGVEGANRFYLVPRVYIACHGLKAAELPELAARYGFERAPEPESDEVRSLIRGFAAARGSGCPWGSPPGCRCATYATASSST